MSELKKGTVIVKNYNVQASGELDALYNRVRLEDEHGRTFYFKEVVVPKYLNRHGAFVSDTPRTWFYKHMSKKSIVILAVEKTGGKIEYDLEDIRLIARSTVLKGVVFSIASVPAAIIAATATFGLGLLLIPAGIWYGYRNIFKLPSMLSRKRLMRDFEQHGITVK
ncbi:hypothetical protein [Pseudomonas phoenicis]|uniref:hypothetical protein n=1 Tax=unclassified Pseudomonas TaxID=196821 RepID=UPI0039A09914